MQALRNRWYCAAFGHELKGEPLARLILNEPVVLYRRLDGTPVAFEDRCCHRHAPLSKGKVEGDNLRCGYHGMVFDPSGTAIWAPAQDRPPRGARVRTFPVVERSGWVFIWMGDVALADAATAPNYDKYGHPAWASYDGLIGVKANYFLVIDNLLDASHLPFVHAATIGSPEDTNPQLTWERGPDWVRGMRISRGLSPSSNRSLEGLDFRFDRTQVMLFEPPSQVTFHITTNESGKEYGDLSSRMNRRIVIYNAATPETDTSCHYFWAVARDYSIDDPKHTELLLRTTSATFDEDRLILEAQQRSIDLAPNAPRIDLIGDAGGLHAQRVLKHMLADEHLAAAAAQ